MFAQPVADILPSELIYEILLHAAKSSTSSCRTLCQVSTWTRCLALPHLYTTVFTTPQTLPMLYLSLGSPPVLPPDSSFDQVTAVQNLWLAFRSERPTHNLLKIRIVQRCRNLSHLAIDARDLVSAAFFKTRRQDPDIPNRRDLHVLMLHNSVGSTYSSEDGSIFTRITHLRLGDPVELYTQLRLENMCCLTHFAALRRTANVEELECILVAIRDTPIEVFVLIVSGAYLDGSQCRSIEDWVRETRKVDKRIYIARSLHDEHEKEWETEVRGGATIWERAFEYTRLRCDSQ